MKKQKTYIKYLNRLWHSLSKVIKAFVSGISPEKVNLKPNQNTKVYIEDEVIKIDREKHYHRPFNKPVAEKQTLLKETKKV